MGLLARLLEAKGTEEGAAEAAAVRDRAKGMQAEVC
jgi:hypothetical protein